MSVHYKFKSTLDYDTVSFDGLHISVADLKKAIFHQKRIGKNTDFDLQITNAQTKEDYTDDNALIAKNTSLIVARVPLTVQQKRSWDRNETPSFSNLKDESNLGRAVDLTRLDGSEEDKIRAMMTQSTQDYDPSNYMKIRGANQTGDVPANYRCYKCHQPGHWIKNCPLGTNQEPIEIKKSTGIPRSFMVPVEGPRVPGAMMTPTGQYAVPAIDHQAYKEGKKERPPFSQDPEPAIEKPEIPEDLLCNICKDLLTDAVMIPCCGNSFCDECIRTFLLESEEHECPDCNEKDVSPETLIPNRFLRNAVMNFKNETGYAKRQTYRQSSQTNRQPTVQLEQQKTDQATSQISNQNKSVQPSNATNVSSQEYTESQTANFDSIQQQFSTRTVQPQTRMSRDYDRRRGGSGSGTSSSKLRMDTNISQPRPHGENSGKRRELDSVMRKARESQSSYWNKKLLEVEERDPNRWRHSGYKELYVGGTTSGEPSRGHPRSPRSPRPRSPHIQRPRSPRTRSPRSPRDKSHTRGRPTRSPSTGSTCSDRSCSVCSPKERRRIAQPSRSRSRSLTPVRARAHQKEVIPSSSRVIPTRTRPRSPPLPRPCTPPPTPQPPPRHQKDYKIIKEKETKVRRKEKHHTRIPEDPRVPDSIPLMRKPVKVEKTHSSHGSTQMIRPPPESSPSEDSDSSSTTSHVGPPRMTLSERFGKMAQWSVDRRDMENMRITKDGENAMKVVIEGEERIARLGYDSPPPGHYPESLLAQGPRGLECWDDVRVRYDYYKARGYLRDLTLDDYIKWEEWWYKYQEWLEAERFYEQWASSNRPSGGNRKRRGRRNNTTH